ncbi:MAG TPA: glycosyltransferase family 4 protein [Anaerolineae bacterium]|nr:glycosyltransferase family 4 protein [Anaerolineae bacterium]
MPYRILMIAPTSFFGDYGCHVRILEETLALQALGHRVRIVTYPRGRDLPNIEIERTMPIPWRVKYEVGSSRHKVGLDIFLTSRVLRAARRFKPDIIHGHLHEGALLGWLAARVFNKPLVFDFQGSLTSEMVDHHFLNPRGILYKPLRWLEGWIDRQPTYVFTSAAYQANLLTNEYGVAPSRIVHIPDAVNPEWFRPWSDREREEFRTKKFQLKADTLGIDPYRPVVVYLGLLADYQGVGLLLDTAKRVLEHGTDAHFVIMGYPGAEKYITRTRAMDIADRVIFPGRIAYEDIARWLAIGNVAVAPKLSQTEGNGKILNYMASGLPVVAFDTPVSRDYLGDDGVYAPIGDVDALACGIESLLADRAAAQALGKRLRARAIEKFSWDASARKIEIAYNSILKMPRVLDPKGYAPENGAKNPSSLENALDKTERLC